MQASPRSLPPARARAGRASGAVPDPALLGPMADAVPWPLLIVSPAAELLFANRAARALLATGQGLRLTRHGAVMPGPRDAASGWFLALQAAAGGLAQTLQWPLRECAIECRVQRLAGAETTAGSPGEPTALLLALALPPAAR